MSGKISGLIVVILFLCMAVVAGAAQNAAPKAGSPLPKMDLLKPNNSADLKYLGLSFFGKTFQVDRVKAQVVIIQVFSMYCPYCQADAPNVNRLYGMIENSPALKNKIKIIGIGAGNTPFEVETFKKKYKVPFPLIPDEGFKVHKILGEVRTPYFIAAKIAPNGRTEVIYSRLGALENNEKFLAQLVKSASIK